MKKLHPDIALSCAIMLFAGFLIFYLIPVGVAVPSSVKHLPLSPRFLPYVLSIFIFCVAAIMLILALRAPTLVLDTGDDSDRRADWPVKLGVLAVVALFYWLLPETIGMLLTTIVNVTLLLLIGGERRVWVIGTVGVLIPSLTYYVFTEVFYVSLPAGSLFGY